MQFVRGSGKPPRRQFGLLTNQPGGKAHRSPPRLKLDVRGSFQTWHIGEVQVALDEDVLRPAISSMQTQSIACHQRLEFGGNGER